MLWTEDGHFAQARTLPAVCMGLAIKFQALDDFNGIHMQHNLQIW